MNEAKAHQIAAASRDTRSGEKKTLALEIGPGAGSLTIQLSRLFDQVLALEIDPHLIGVLEESLAGYNNIKVINTDAMKFDYKRLEAEYPEYEIAVCSNLPYYITSELIMGFLESHVRLSSVTVLIQKEACNRFIAVPGSPDYGSITASVSYYATAKKLFLVGPGNFIPRPQVDSAVLQLIPHNHAPVSVQNEDLLFRVIRGAFSARRKTLLNTLSTYFSPHFSKEDVQNILLSCGIDPTRRGETLQLVEFAKIADAFFAKS